MVADRNLVYDGQEYAPGDTLPDLGSLECVGTDGNKRMYQGYIQDKDKLPKYDDLGTGSSATLIDPNGVESTVIAKYQATDKTWVNMTGGIVL